MFTVPKIALTISKVREAVRVSEKRGQTRFQSFCYPTDLTPTDKDIRHAPTRTYCHTRYPPAYHPTRQQTVSACFYAQDDYTRYLETLAEMSLRYEWRNSCLRIDDQSRPSVAVTGTQRQRKPADETSGQRYVQYIKRQSDAAYAVGRRIPFMLAQRDEYVLTCYRYIELNPVGPAWWRIREITAGPATEVMHKATLTSYTPHHEFERLWQHGHRASRHYQRFLSNSDLTPHPPPRSCSGRTCRGIAYRLQAFEALPSSSARLSRPSLCLMILSLLFSMRVSSLWF